MRVRQKSWSFGSDISPPMIHHLHCRWHQCILKARFTSLLHKLPAVMLDQAGPGIYHWTTTTTIVRCPYETKQEGRQKDLRALVRKGSPWDSKARELLSLQVILKFTHLPCQVKVAVCEGEVVLTVFDKRGSAVSWWLHSSVFNLETCLLLFCPWLSSQTIQNN